ncbi:hypothetical protein I2I05_21035 [Hymenobacter sp. BT683]|uniref:Uncharacterized protein n=1 Tax=Hymenobacter jeongseonensis TaxID=2791027 RepID=A0ABS0IND9_9BACT|nr:hypothetical protein [Hymenobacter jeongseonensis]MBF9239890.1 hypothetical protein [Hymenobacter jeongseonensis]
MGPWPNTVPAPGRRRYPTAVGVGEAAPLAGLRLDNAPTFPVAIAPRCERFNAGVWATISAADAPAFAGPGFPTLVLALDRARGRVVPLP